MCIDLHCSLYFVPKLCAAYLIVYRAQILILISNRLFSFLFFIYRAVHIPSKLTNTNAWASKSLHSSHSNPAHSGLEVRERMRMLKMLLIHSAIFSSVMKAPSFLLGQPTSSPHRLASFCLTCVVSFLPRSFPPSPV